MPTLNLGNDLLLARAPVADNHAANKGYVDDTIAAQIAALGTAASADTGTAAGNVPVLNASGKLSDSVIPSLAIGEVFSVESEAEQLALTEAQRGDVCVRTDLNRTYILASADDNAYATLTNWIEIVSPTDAVTSVNGLHGQVVVAAVPDGGTTGQILTKTASGYEWADAPASASAYTGTFTGDGSTLTFELTHNLNDINVSAEVFINGGTEQMPTRTPIMVLVTRTGVNKVQVDFSVPPANGVVYTVVCRKS